MDDDELRAWLNDKGICTTCLGVGENAFYPGSPCFTCRPDEQPTPKWCNPMDTLYDLVENLDPDYDLPLIHPDHGGKLETWAAEVWAREGEDDE